MNGPQGDNSFVQVCSITYRSAMCYSNTYKVLFRMDQRSRVENSTVTCYTVEVGRAVQGRAGQVTVGQDRIRHRVMVCFR